MPLDPIVATSKLLSYVLRHRPDSIGLTLDAQGHSVAVDLGLAPEAPPDVLYHGTASRFLKSIWSIGLRASGRHHVHLSKDVDTARRVGARHGFPVVLRVDAQRMHADGMVFYRSDNGVWLTETVLPRYLEPIPVGSDSGLLR
jgi:putative RNA 2'-phosphotransferase